jgi:hypothetical protein
MRRNVVLLDLTGISDRSTAKHSGNGKELAVKLKNDNAWPAYDH